MNREKRASKQPEQYVIPEICYPRKRKKYKKKNTIRGEYIYIPAPLKFIYNQNFYAIYGDLSLVERDGTLRTGTSLISQYMLCRGITISDLKTTRLISIDFERRLEFEPPPWQIMVERLQESQYPDQREWAQLIEKFSLNYENMLRARSSDMLNIRGYEEDKLAALAEQGEKVLIEKFEKYPCIYFKSEVINNTIRFSNITINEKYLNELGHTVDSLTNAILTEGVPQLSPIGCEEYDKPYVTNYFSPQSSFKELSELEVFIPTKSGFVSKRTCKAFLIPRMSDKTFSMNHLTVITGKHEEVRRNTANQGLKVNKKFLEEMVKKEKDAQSFLNRYYRSEQIFKPYTDAAQICQVKEVGNEVVIDDERDFHDRRINKEV